MDKNASIRCACGHRVTSRDVLSQGLLLHHDRGESVFVKFRCPRCKRLGQARIRRDRWDWSVLDDEAGEGAQDDLTPEERARFGEMGPIDADETDAFRLLLVTAVRLPGGES